jgi:hypothetical protein
VKLPDILVYVVPGDQAPHTGYIADEVVIRASEPVGDPTMQLVAHLRTALAFVRRDTAFPPQVIKRAEGWFNRYHPEMPSVDKERMLASAVKRVMDGSPIDSHIKQWMTEQGAVGVAGINTLMGGSVLGERSNIHKAIASMLRLDRLQSYKRWALKRRISNAEQVLPPAK